MANTALHASGKSLAPGALFTRSLEQVLHAFIRLIIGRLSLSKLQELIRNIYLKEAEQRLKKDLPKSRVTLSQLALLTGIDTRTLTKITNDEGYAKPVHEDEDFLNEMTPETCILSIWMSDSRFYDEETDRPRVLSLDSGQQSFSALVRAALSGRGFTYQSILARLEKVGSVSVDREKQRVRLISNNFYPFLTDDDSAMLDVGFSAAVGLFRTIASNIESRHTGEEALFQRTTFTYSLPSHRKEEFRQKIRQFLSQADDDCKALMAEMEDSTPRPGQVTAGVSMFYFESSNGI